MKVFFLSVSCLLVEDGLCSKGLWEVEFGNVSHRFSTKAL